MEERQDLKGPYEDTIELEEMSREFLIKLLKEWQEQYRVLNEGLYAAALKRIPMEQFNEILMEANEHMYKATMPRLNRLAGIEPETLLDLNRVGQLSIDANKSQGYFVSHEEILSPNHFISTVTKCPYLEAAEDMGIPEFIRPLCEVVEPYLMPFYYQNHPKLKITPLKLPPRKDKSEICCKLEFKIEE